MAGPSPAVPPMASGARLPGLDALRALAIIWVMIYHAEGFGLVPDGRLVGHGWMGVDLFFVLSGYLIGGQIFRPLARGQQLRFGGFYARRALRTFPAFAVVAFIFTVPQWREQPAIQPLWQFATFTENLFVHVRPPKAFSHVWSLCVEEQFYLLFPLAVLALSWRPRLWTAVTAGLAILLGGMALRGAIWMHDLSPFYAHGVFKLGYVAAYMDHIYLPTWTRLDGLLMGVLAAAAEAFRPRLWQAMASRANLLLCTGAAGLLTAFAVFKTQFPGLFGTVAGYPLLSASLGLIVVAAASPNCVLLRRPIPGARAVAAISYSLYLSHKLMLHWAVVRFHADPDHVRWLPGTVAFAAAVAAASVLYLLVERPFLKLRRRLPVAHRQPVAPAPVAV